MNPSIDAPRHVAVVGAGLVGLSTAWFLQERGVQVTVLEKEAVAAGASLGNAGWLTPSLATPLPEPSVLAYGLRALLTPASPVYIAPGSVLPMLPFLVRFALNCTTRRWQKAMHSMVPINGLALESFELLAAGGVDAKTVEATSFMVGYRTAEERATLIDELTHIRSCGQEVSYDELSGAEARALEPSFSTAIGAALRLHGQRYIHPGEFIAALAASVRDRGGEVLEGVAVTDIRDTARSVSVRTGTGTREFDAIVVATGTWLGGLARHWGVRTAVRSGRGYSFSVPIDHIPAGPVYFPAQRVACTPLGDRLRVAGMMEFRPPHAPLDPRRIKALVDAARPLLDGADLDSRIDEWVGPRPCTADGLPVIGSTRSSRVFVAGGHGMWGVALGPATGRLLAEQIVTGSTRPELRPFDPLRASTRRTA